MHSSESGRTAGIAADEHCRALLHTPNPERLVTSNVWALLHWLRVAKGLDLPGWSALQHFSAVDAPRFGVIMAEFARLPAGPIRLARHRGEREALVHRTAAGSRRAWTRDELRDQPGTELPPEVAAALTRTWPTSLLVGPLAELLLHADLRPDDRLLIAGVATWPWLAAVLVATTAIIADASPETLLAATAEEHASVLVATPEVVIEAVRQCPEACRPLVGLRAIIVSGGPLPPETEALIFASIAPRAMLLARTDDALWGNPLEYGPDRPRRTPAFFGPQADP